MKKVLMDFLMILIFLGTPLAIMLAMPADGSIGIGLLPVLPIFVLGGLAFLRICFIEEFFFEAWIQKWPVIGKQALGAMIALIIFAQMRIVIGSHLYTVSIQPPGAISEEDEIALKELDHNWH
ncbi:MAG: hypothetical protein ABIP54_00760 [Candidatus Andersenbacteria bacterium]